MGVFNSIYVKCPDCTGHTKFQSKVDGGCSTYFYEKDSIPPRTLADLDGKTAECPFCGCRFKLSSFVMLLISK